MFGRLCGFKRIVVAGLFPGVNVFDDTQIIRDSKTGQVILNELEQSKITGWNRLYYMYSVDEFGEVSPEMVSVLQAAMMSLFVGGVIGGFVKSRTAFLDFVEHNDATKFETHIEAKKILQNKVTVAFGKGAFQWAWRLTAFTSTYMVLSTSISVYKGNSGVWEHSVAGMVTGALYKINVGLRGIVVGGTLGLVLGTFSGLITWGLLSLTGTSMEEVRNMHYTVKQKRDLSWKKALKNREEEDASEAERAYEGKVGNIVHDLDSIPSQQLNNETKKETK